MEKFHKAMVSWATAHDLRFGGLTTMANPNIKGEKWICVATTTLLD